MRRLYVHSVRELIIIKPYISHIQDQRDRERAALRSDGAMARQRHNFPITFVYPSYNHLIYLKASVSHALRCHIFRRELA